MWLGMQLVRGIACVGLAVPLQAAGQAATQAGAPPPAAPMVIRVVGGLARLHAYTLHEEPFWRTQLASLSGGRYRADIVPFDSAGIRSSEMLSLMQSGVVPFGNAILSASAGKDPELGAPDLAGLNPDMATLRRTVAAYRPHLLATLRQRYGIELLAVYAYPAQVLFCKTAFDNLDGIKGRRVRTSSPSQADWVQALDALPLATAFADIMPSLRNGSIDCAITGTMSGNTIGLHEQSSQLHPMAVSWGLAMFAANGAAWHALPADLQALLRRELPVLEKAIWEEADRETAAGIACNVGAAACRGGSSGRMTALPLTPADEQRGRRIFQGTVLPRWLARCGAACAPVWNRTLAPVAAVEAQAPK